MIDTYDEWSEDNPKNHKETEKDFENFLEEQAKPDRELIENYVNIYIDKYKESQKRVVYLKAKEEEVKLFFSLLDYSMPKDMENLNKLLELGKQIKSKL